MNSPATQRTNARPIRCGAARRILMAAVVGLVAIGVAPPAPLEAHTWVINADGSGDAPTIQAGIDLASPGDTVLVTPGTYAHIAIDATGSHAAASMTSGVVLKSVGGPEATVIDVESVEATRGVTCLDCDAGTVVDGFTIVGGDVYFGAGIYVNGGAPEIRNNIILEAYGGTGGGMIVTGGAAPVVSRNRFDANQACCGVGGAMLVESGSAPQILDNVFVDNNGFGGGAVALINASGVIEGNEFTGNTGTDGAAILVRSSDTLVRDNVFTDNHSSTGGGAVAFVFGSTSRFEDNLVTGNIADGSGGGLLIDGASPEIVGTTIADNWATSGAGVFITGVAAPILDRVLVAFNQGSDGITCASPLALPVFTCNDVFGNDGEPYAGSCSDQTGIAGNFSADPLFCEGSYLLDELSPCVAGHGCGRIGARGVGCSGTTSAVAPSTWGAIKAGFR